MNDSCALCGGSEPNLLWHDKYCRIILMDHEDYPGYCCIVWTKHVREVSDLALAEHLHVSHVMWVLDRVLREVLHADKINWASFGNKVPHLHWHAIPRFQDDRHFPESIWGQEQREVKAPSVKHPQKWCTYQIQAALQHYLDD
jgi:diadenosine tetraphosphate (Ap4A) HIT family hydrolase